MSDFNERAWKSLLLYLDLAPPDSEKIRNAAVVVLRENGLDPRAVVQVDRSNLLMEHLPPLRQRLGNGYYMLWELLVAAVKLEKVR